MYLAKVPDNDSDWQSLDIYLFSNGQQQTPPRKYHLPVEDLINWEVTLKTLAGSQYGSNCSKIHLYTTEGLKVENAMEIKNEDAYVAVPLQDAFICAGYKEYMLKASRSREKRLEKLKQPNSKRFPPSGKNMHNKFLAKGDTDKSKHNNFGNTNKNKISWKNQKNIIPHTSNDVNSKTQVKKIFRNSSLRQNIYDVPPTVIGRNSFPGKGNVQKKKLNTARLDVNTPITNNYITHLAPSVITETDQPEVNAQLKNINDISPHKQDIITVIENKDFTDTEQEKTNIKINAANKAVVNTTENNYLFIKTILSSIMSDMPMIELNKDTNIIATDINCLHHADNCDNGENPNDETLKLSDKHFLQEPKKSKVVASQQTHNFISIVDKGEVIDLNIRMEIRKGDGVISANYEYNTNYCMGLSEQHAKNNTNDVFSQSLKEERNPKNNFNTNYCIDLSEQHAKVHINDVLSQSLEEERSPNNFKEHIQNSDVQECTCEEFFDFDEIIHKINNSEDLVNKKFVFLLTNPINDQNEQRLSCDQEGVQNNCRIQQLNSLLKNQNDRHDIFLKCPDNNTIENRYTTIESRKNSVGHSQKTASLEDLQIRTNDLCMKNDFISKSTQTEWFSLLVEARLREDNRYTFHFPSLSALKEYFS